MNVMIVTRVDFNNLENNSSAAIRKQEPVVFVGTAKETADYKVTQYIQTLEVDLYLGWNKEVYPQFEIKESNAT